MLEKAGGLRRGHITRAGTLHGQSPGWQADPPFSWGGCLPLCCPAPLACGNYSGEAERCSGIGLKLFGFIAESAFTFIPESCSRSPRNRVRNHPGIAFTFPRIPQSLLRERLFRCQRHNFTRVVRRMVVDRQSMARRTRPSRCHDFQSAGREADSRLGARASQARHFSPLMNDKRSRRPQGLVHKPTTERRGAVCSEQGSGSVLCPSWRIVHPGS